MKKVLFYLIVALLSLPTYGQTSLVSSNCGATVSNPDTFIYCNLVSNAQEYKFEVREAGSLVQEVVSVDNKIQPSEFGGIYGRTYSIKVAAKVGGTISSYGTACNVSIAFPTTSLVSNNCGVTIQDENQYLYCLSHASAQGYKFEVTPSGGTAVEYSSTVNKFRLSDALTPQPGVTYTVRASGQYGGKYAPYGSLCNVTLVFPTTSLVSSDCGVTVTGDQYLYSTSISGASAYKFEIKPAGGTAISKEFTSNKFRLSDVVTVNPMTSYTVKVAAKIGGVVGPYGSACTVTTTGFITRLVDSNCGKTITGADQILYCLKDLKAESYMFEVTPPGETPITKEFTTNSFKLSDVLTTVKGSTTYTVRAKAKFSGTYAPYGTACTVITPGTTSLVANSCNINVSSTETILYATILPDVTNYRFKVTEGTTLVGTFETTINRLKLSDVNGKFGRTYSVSVAVKRTGSSVFGDYGDACTVTTPTLPTTSMVSNDCNVTLTDQNKTLYCLLASGALAYRFEITPEGGTAVYHEVSTNKFKLADVLTPQSETTYSIRVQGKFTNGYGDYGKVCTVKTPPIVVPEFTLHSNGVTCLCPNAKVGDKGYVNGKTYTKRTKDQITDTNASTTCTSGITDMNTLIVLNKFNSNFNDDISHWDVSSVTNMESMFWYASSFNQDLKYWDVSNVTNMRGMFSKTNAFNGDISKWNVSKVTNMITMFKEAYAFNGDISKWDVSNVTDMGSMFAVANKFNQDISGWNVSKVTDMNNMFASAWVFNQNIGGWNVSNVTDMGNMFYDARVFNQDIGSWDVKNVTVMNRMFSKANVFNQNLAGWCVKQFSSEPLEFSLDSPLSNNNKPKWGLLCTLKSKLVSNQCDTNIATPATVIYCLKYTDVIKYKFELTENENLVGVYETDTNTFKLTDANGTYGKTYKVRVALKRTGDTAFDDYGNACTVTVPAAPTNSLLTSSCNIKVSGGDQILYCTRFLSAEGYRFEITPQGGTSKTYESTDNKFKLSDIYTSVPYSKTFTVRVASKFGGVYTPYGSACTISTPDVTKLVDTQCGSSLASVQSLVYCYIKSNVTNYKFEVSQAGKVIGVYETDINKFKLSDVGGVNAKLYSVRVALKYSGSTVYGGYGPSCEIASSKFYTHNNGVTCMCPDAAVGDAGTVNGVTYTKRTKDQITAANASTTCTSGITDMSLLFYDERTYYLPFTNSFNEDVSSWDVSSVTSMDNMFSTCDKFNQDISNWDVSKVVNMNGMFYKARLFNQDISKWDVSNVTLMSHMFNSAKSFNQPIGGWDVSNVTSMRSMFSDATTFNQPIGNWNLGKVTNMMLMFYDAQSFNQDISKWDVSKVTNMAILFRGATSFNQPIGNWDVSKVTNMNSAFYNATSFNQSLKNWCVSHIASEPSSFATNSGLLAENKPNWGAECPVNNPNFYLHSNGVTCLCPNAAVGEKGTVNGVTYTKRTKDQITAANASTTCTSGITDMGNLFSYNSNFNGNISTWDVSQVTNMARMFYVTAAFNQPIGNWDVSKVIYMAEMFSFTTVFNQPIGNWNVSQVTNMAGMFNAADAFNQPIGNWDVSKVTNMSQMFYETTAFNQPIGNWDVSQVTNMAEMFYEATAFNQPIGNWDVSSVTSMYYMFYGASLFNQSLKNWCVSQISTEPYNFSEYSPLSSSNKPNWGSQCVYNSNFYLHSNGVTCMCPDAAVGEVGTVNGVTYTKRTKDQITAANASTTCTSGITDMSGLFMNNTDFNGDISTWDVSQVTNMDNMFADALRFNQPIGNWDVSSVTSMSYMFWWANDFNQPIGGWDVSNVTSMRSMFYFTSRFNQPIGNWDVSKVINMAGMFDHAASFGQPIGDWDVSSVTNMNEMFNQAIQFNQSLTNWCVSQISTEPYYFADDSPLSSSNKPKWGATCSSLRPSLDESKSVGAIASPNPFTDVFGILYASESEENVSIVIYDMAGRVVEQSEIGANQLNSQSYGRNFSSGVYNVVLTQGANTYTLRLVKD